MGAKSLAVALLLIHAARVAAGQPAPKPLVADPRTERVLLIGSPELEAPSLEGVDIVRAALERGALAGVGKDKRYQRAISLRDLELEKARYIDPVLKFAAFSEQTVLNHIANRYKLRQKLSLNAYLLPRFFRSSSGELVTELELWIPGEPEWKLIAKKSIGGCGASLEEVAERAGQAAFQLTSDDTPSVSITVRARVEPLAPPVDDKVTAKTGEPLVLDSCATVDPKQDAFLVKWSQAKCGGAGAAPCVLSQTSIRRRQRIVLDEPAKYLFSLEVTPDSGTCATTRSCTTQEKKITVEAVEPPKARPRVRTDKPVPRQVQPPVIRHRSKAAEYQQSVTQEPVQLDLEQALERQAAAQQAIAAAISVTTIRVAPGKTTTVYLDGTESSPTPPSEGAVANPNHKYTWRQLEGPTVPMGGTDATRTITADWSKPGLYVFSLTVQSGPYDHTDRISFLVAPEIFADAGADRDVYVGDRVVLDVHGSYDVLDDSPLFTWAVTNAMDFDGDGFWNINDDCPDQASDIPWTDDRRPDRAGCPLSDVEALVTPRRPQAFKPGARIVNPNSRTPEFVAQDDGEYRVHVFVRARRTLGEHKLWDVATDDMIIRATGGRHRISLHATGLLEVQSESNRHFLGGAIEYRYQRDLGVFRTRAQIGARKEMTSWDPKLDVISAEIGLRPFPAVSIFGGVSATPNPFQGGISGGIEVAFPSCRICQYLGLDAVIDLAAGLLFGGDARPFIGVGLGVGYSLR